jgi:hypothetical protein
MESVALIESISMKNLSIVLLSIGTFIGTIYMNYLFSTGYDGRRSMGEISAEYATAITPAGFAFAIWGLIYLGLTILCITLIRELIQKKDNGLIQKAGLWFVASNLLNAAWIYYWTSEMFFISVLIILGLLFSLLMLTKRAQSLSSPKIFSLTTVSKTTISIYTGWVIAATVLNISIWIATLGLAYLEYAFIPLSILLVAAGIYFYTAYHFPNSAILLVGAWAFYGIGKNHEELIPVALLALMLSGILFTVGVIHLFLTRIMH